MGRGEVEIPQKNISLKKVTMYFCNFEKENEWRYSLKGSLPVLEIPGTLMYLVLSPRAAEKDWVKWGDTILLVWQALQNCTAQVSLSYAGSSNLPRNTQTVSAYQKTVFDKPRFRQNELTSESTTWEVKDNSKANLCAIRKERKYTCIKH